MEERGEEKEEEGGTRWERRRHRVAVCTDDRYRPRFRWVYCSTHHVLQIQQTWTLLRFCPEVTEGEQMHMGAYKIVTHVEHEENEDEEKVEGMGAVEEEHEDEGAGDDTLVNLNKWEGYADEYASSDDDDCLVVLFQSGFQLLHAYEGV